MKESEFIQRAKKDDSKNNPGFEQSHNEVDSILPPTQHLQIRVSSNIVNLTFYNKTEKYVRTEISMRRICSHLHICKNSNGK